MRDPASSPGPGVRVPHPIEAESYAILRSRLDTADLPPLTRAVVERVVHTSADPSWAGDLVCDEAALRAGRAALLAGAPLVTDVRMVAVGVTARTVDRRPRPGRPSRAPLASGRRPGRPPGSGPRPGGTRSGRSGPSATPRPRWPSCCAAPRPGCWTRRWSSACRSGSSARSRRRPRCGRPACPRCPTAPNAGARRWPRPPSTPCSTRRSTRDRPLLLVGHGTVDADRRGRVRRVHRSVAPAAGRRGRRRRRRLHRAVPAHRARGLGAARRPRAPSAGRRAAGAGRGRARQGRHPRRAAARDAAPPGQRLRVRPPARPAPGAAGAAGRPDRRRRWAPRRRTGTAVLLVGRGSTDPDANAEVCKVARLLQEGRRYAVVEPAFVSLAAPGRARRAGPLRGAGRAPDRRRARTSCSTGCCRAGSSHQAARSPPSTRELDVRTAGYLGDTDALAGLVVERYREALHGDIRMNCDTCAYRVLLPGFEDKLGAPQTPHHHPDDPAHGHGARARARARARGGGRVSMDPYLVGLDLAGRRVVVVGGGTVAQRRVTGLLAAGADVEVVAPRSPRRSRRMADRARAALDRPRATATATSTAPGTSIACTDDPAVNAAVGAEAERPAGVLRARRRRPGRQRGHPGRRPPRRADRRRARRPRAAPRRPRCAPRWWRRCRPGWSTTPRSRCAPGWRWSAAAPATPS